MQAATMTMQDIMRSARSRRHASQRVDECLAYPGMTEVPASFNRMAHTDFALSSEADESLEWEDYCPAYAMGLLTYDAYYRIVTRVSEVELRAQWDELRGISRLSWKQAQAVIARSWNALAQLEHDGCIY